MHKLPFRQIHLDFHTSEAIPAIGAGFDAREWVKTLTDAAVNSVTLFAVCHHGWHYHPTAVGRMHPQLDFDLLRAQFEAVKSAGIRAPLYITGGFNQQLADRHLDYQVVWCDQGRGQIRNPLEPGYKLLCFNSPYLDYLCDEVQETARLFPDADGIFIDIISAPDCVCPWCLAQMRRLGLDAGKQEDRDRHRKLVLDHYYRRTLAALREVAPDMPLFQNSGNIPRGERKFFDYVTHLELESLPTGGWGYDHFPMSALAAAHSGLDYLGMTGKFHTTWGEFGGFKHPNALRYECSLMLAFGSKCSVGDQLHPGGKLDESTYNIIGAAYREVAAKEPWCDGLRRVADVAVLSSATAAHGITHEEADTGACRLLLESHVLFDLISFDDDFSGYRMLICPDQVKIDAALKERLEAYAAGGGRVLCSGSSGLDGEGRSCFDFGGTVGGASEFSPDYVLPLARLMPEWCRTPFVMYERSHRLTVTDGESLGELFDPYFQRAWDHFSSHQHTPNRLEATPYSFGVRKGNFTYLAHPVFTQYRRSGAVLLRECLARLIADTLGAPPTVAVEGLPSTGRVALSEQAAFRRYVLHLLYGEMAPRGGSPENPAGVTVIEDLPELSGVQVTVRLPERFQRVTLEPEGRELTCSYDGDTLRFTLPPFQCHAMIALHY